MTTTQTSKSRIEGAVYESSTQPCRGCGCTRRTVSVNRSKRYATRGCVRCRTRSSYDFAPDCLRLLVNVEDWAKWLDNFYG